MHSAQSTFDDDLEGEGPEPVVLSYLQFRNHLGLLDWRRRRAEYEQHGALAVRKPHAATAPGRA